MIGAGSLRLLAAVLLAVLLSGCQRERRTLTDAEIRTLSSLDEVMAYQAEIAEPRFELAHLRSDGFVTDDDFDAFLHMASGLRTTAAKLEEFRLERRYGEWWDELARRQAERATQLIQAVKERDDHLALEHVLAIEANCNRCHDRLPF